MSSDANTKLHSDWEKIYVDHLTYSINLFLVTATGALGFCISQLISRSQNDYQSSFRFAAVCLFVSIIAGAICTITRLILFLIRKPARDVNNMLHSISAWLLPTDDTKKKSEGRLETMVFAMFIIQIIVFVIGIVPLGLQVAWSSTT
jgi:hypothetical protein